MTWRLAIDRQRNDRRRTSREQENAGPPIPPAETATEAVDARERAEHLWAAIDTLPEKLRVVVVLSNIEEHDIGDVARLLGLPPGTVKSRLLMYWTKAGAVGLLTS